MSKLEVLVARYCPHGVEWKTLGEVFTRIRGTPITATKMKEIANPDGDIRIFAGGKTVIDAFEKDIPKANITTVPAVLVQSRGVIDFVFYDKPFTFKNEMWAYTTNNKVTIKFLYYVLKNNVDYFRNIASVKGSLPQISLPVTEDFKIPLPPICVQREIVGILDLFTELTAELTAELELRKKQYAYYREVLLSFDEKSPSVIKEMTKRLCPNGVEYGTLGEIGKVSMCKRIMKSETSAVGDVPFYKIGTFGKTANAFISKELFHKYKEAYSYPNKGDVLISAAGTIGRSVIFDGKPAYFQDSNIVWIANDETKILNKFLYYWYQTFPWKVSTGGTIDRLYNDDIARTKIPLPPLEIQHKIVEILDKFDTLTTSLTEGIPAEIEARRKQYHYYRNKLLTFKEQVPNLTK